MQKQLRLGVIPTIAPFVLPNLMPILRERFPKLQLMLREDLTSNLLARIRSRQLDFALIALPYDVDDLKVSPLYQDKFWLVGLENDRAMSDKGIQINSQWTERLLLLEEGHCLRDHVLQACNTSEVASVNGIEATSLLTLVQMVSSGLGVALLPELAIQSGLLHGTTLKARPLASPAPERTIALVARPTSAHMIEFEAIAKLIAEESRKNCR